MTKPPALVRSHSNELIMTRRSNKPQQMPPVKQQHQQPPPPLQPPQAMLQRVGSSPSLRGYSGSSSRPSPQRSVVIVDDIQLKQHISNAPPVQVFTRGQFGAVKTRPSSHHGGGSSTAGSIDETSSRGSSVVGVVGGGRPHRNTSRNKKTTSHHRSHSQDHAKNNHRRRSSPSDFSSRGGDTSHRVRLSQRATTTTASHYPPQRPQQHSIISTSRPRPVVVIPRSNASVASSNHISSVGSAEADQNSVHSAPSVWHSNSNPEQWRSNNPASSVVEWREPIQSTSSSSRKGSPSIIIKQNQQQQHNEHSHQTTVRDISPARSNKSSIAGEDSQKNFMRTTKRVVEEIIRAQGTRRRIEAITNACEIFDHYDEARHNIELYQGAAQALAKMLEYPQNDDTIRMVCSALEMVFRGSTRTVQQSYSKCGSALLTNLLHLLARCDQGEVKHAHITILNITRILLYLSKCPDLRYPLCRNQDLLDCFTRVLDSNDQLTNDCRALRMRILANLAAGDKNKVLLYEQIGLLYNVLRIANLDSSDLARQHAAAVLQELATCTFLHVSMSSNDQLLGTLVKLALKEKSMQTRESAIWALQTLAYTKENRSRLVEFKDGVVLEALRVAISKDADDKVRRRAAGALTNLACEDTAESMGNHKGLLGALAIVSTKDTNVDVQTRASLALTKIGSNINSSMACFETLLDALVVASLSTTSNSVTAVLRVKAREPQNREVMARHSCVLDTLADICVSPGAAIADRDNAMRTLMHLVNDSRNRLVMCNKIILDALVIGSNFEEPKLMEARESAIITLERLATEPSNRPRMARHAGLLVAVSRAVEREAKWEDAKIESEHGYLAKPLLMSLLLAM